MNDLTTFQQIAAFVFGVLATARVARLLVWDDYPPTLWLRGKWDRLTRWEEPDQSAWAKLLHCQFCLTPYLALINFGWAWWSGLGFHDVWGLLWWIANGVTAGSYLAASYVAYDQPDE